MLKHFLININQSSTVFGIVKVTEQHGYVRNLCMMNI